MSTKSRAAEQRRRANKWRRMMATIQPLDPLTLRMAVAQGCELLIASHTSYKVGLQGKWRCIQHSGYNMVFIVGGGFDFIAANNVNAAFHRKPSLHSNVPKYIIGYRPAQGGCTTCKAMAQGSTQEVPDYDPTR